MDATKWVLVGIRRPRGGAMIEWIAGCAVVYGVAVTLLALDLGVRLRMAREDACHSDDQRRKLRELLQLSETDLARERVRSQHEANRSDGFRERIRELKPDEFAATDDAGDVIRAITGGTELPDVE